MPSFSHIATRRSGKAGAAIILFLMLVSVHVHAAIVFAPPDDSPDAANELRAIDREIADRNFAAAAKRLESLVSARGDPLASVGEGTLISATAWVDRLPLEIRAALATEYGRAYGKTAAQSLDSLRNSPAARPEELYAIARRYPLAPATAEALVQAGDRAVKLGDLPAAQAFYELAARARRPTEANTARLDLLKGVNAGTPIAPPADLPGIAAPHATGRPTILGPLPFDARWYGNPSMAASPKYFPLACDGALVLATARGVTLFDADSGHARWDSPHPRPAPNYTAERGTAANRGALFAPAVLFDVHGRPAIVVARYPTAGGEEARFVLRACAAADGKTLWTSDATDQPKDLSYAGLPAVAGRYVYTLAVARTGPSTGNLLLSAVDVSTGSAIWQTPIGTVAEQAEARGGGRKNLRNEPLSLDAFAELSEPAVAGDCVYVAPNCGSIIAVGRFDGRIRWVHVYREPDVPNANGRDLRVKPGHWMDARDAQRAPLVRYRSTPVVCGDVVVAMPQDIPAVFAVNRLDGRRLWDTDIIEGFALAGASGNLFVTCGTDTVCGVNATTAKLKWRHKVHGGGVVTGPAIVLGQTVVVPTANGSIQLNVEDGTEHAALTVPNVRRLIDSEALTDPHAARSFGSPSGVQ